MFHPRHHALVAVGAAQLLQAVVVAVDQAHARVTRAVEELAHALVTARGVEMDFGDGLRRGLQPDRQGVEAEEDLFAHPGMVAA
ncbi:hypothetical protein D3C72_2445590 [compost metagenome]